MAPHSIVLAWRIPEIGEPGKLPSMGSHRVGHNQIYISSSSSSMVVANLVWGFFFFLFFLNKLPKCFPGWLYCFTSPPAMGEGSSFSESSPALGVLPRFPHFSHAGGWLRQSLCGFNLHFPNGNAVEHLLMSCLSSACSLR